MASQTFAALRHRNYRLWFRGQMVSLFGTWMQLTAQGFLIFQLTHSPAYLGYVSFANGVPSWLLTLYGGVVADRIPRRTLLLVTQTFMMLLAFALAVLTFLGAVRPWHIIGLSFLLGVANAFDAPARQAFVRELVELPDLTNAIALNAIMFNSAVAVGPAVAGLAYAGLGPAWCFALNGISFLAVIWALSLMRIARTDSPAVRAPAMAGLKEGILYAAHQPMIRTLIGIVAATSLFGISVNTLTPAWAVSVLHGDARTNGWLLSARGVGGLAGGFSIAMLDRFNVRGTLLTAGSVALPVLLLLFAGTRSLPASLAVYLASGAAFILVQNLANALLQTTVPDHLRGRVMGVFMMTFFGSIPLGSLIIGLLAHALGAPLAIALNAACLLGVAGFVYTRIPALRAAR
ncbi:MAG TPA: MFS transporter [bacterium]